MADLPITFSVENDDLFFLMNLFIGDYGRLNSPFFPIYICPDVTETIAVGYIEERVHSNHLVVEAYEDPDQGFREIAKIFMIQHSENEIRVVVEGIQEGKNRWYQVEKLVQSILKYVYDHGYTIMSVFPSNLIPLEMLFPKYILEMEERSTYKVPPPTGILGTEEGVDQSNLEGSESSNLTIHVSKDLETNLPDLSFMNDVDPSGDIPKYGTYRDLTGKQVRSIVEQCRAYQKKGATIKWYYHDILSPSVQNKFALETLKAWLKNPKFKSK